MKMNQLSKLCLAALVATMSLTSCNDDKKETPAPLTDAQMLVGTWEVTNFTMDGKPAEGTEGTEGTEGLIGSTEEFTNDNYVVRCSNKRIFIMPYTLADRVISLNSNIMRPDLLKHTITKLDATSLVFQYKTKVTPDAPESTMEYTLKKVPTNQMFQGLPFLGNWKTSKAFNTSTGTEIPLSELGQKSIDIKLIGSGYVNITLTDLKDDDTMMSFACKLRPNSMPTPVIELYLDPERTVNFGELTILEILDQGKKLKVSIDSIIPDTTLELTR